MGRPSRLAYLLLVSCCCYCNTWAQDATWRSDQANHRSVRLENFGALATVARLDERLDPDGGVFSGLLTPILRSRYVGTQAHDDVRRHIASTLSTLGWSVDADSTFRMTTPVGDKDFTNVVATHDARAPRRLVLACHYDSIYNRPNFVAATDSAVPCAMMLHLATLLTRDYLDPVKGRSDLTLQLIFFDGEEAFRRWSDADSIYGSRHLARQMQDAVYQRTARGSVTDLDRIDLFVLLDLLGAANPRISNLIAETNAEFRQLAGVERKLRRRGLLQDVPNIFKFQRHWGFFGPPQVADDHLPFMRRGVRVLHVIPSPFPSVWHTDGDDASAIHRPTVSNLSRVLRVFVVEYLRLPALLGSERQDSAVIQQ